MASMAIEKGDTRNAKTPPPVQGSANPEESDALDGLVERLRPTTDLHASTLVEAARLGLDLRARAAQDKGPSGPLIALLAGALLLAPLACTKVHSTSVSSASDWRDTTVASASAILVGGEAETRGDDRWLKLSVADTCEQARDKTEGTKHRLEGFWWDVALGAAGIGAGSYLLYCYSSPYRCSNASPSSKSQGLAAGGLSVAGGVVFLGHGAVRAIGATDESTTFTETGKRGPCNVRAVPEGKDVSLVVAKDASFTGEPKSDSRFAFRGAWKWAVEHPERPRHNNGSHRPLGVRV
jgi:hypothetical protein